MMKKILAFSFVLLAFITFRCTQKSTDGSGQDESIHIEKQTEADTIKGSIPAHEDKHLGGATSITIYYTSPAVRGRTIWGGLVPYDSLWVTGAHMATTFESSTALDFGGVKIDAGKYALFTIPGKDEWTVVLNKNWDQHQTDEYNAGEDVLRIKATPEWVEENQERLMFDIDQTGEKKGLVVFRWEKLRIKIPVEAK